MKTIIDSTPIGQTKQNALAMVKYTTVNFTHVNINVKTVVEIATPEVAEVADNQMLHLTIQPLPIVPVMTAPHAIPVVLLRYKHRSTIHITSIPAGAAVMPVTDLIALPVVTSLATLAIA